MNDKDCTECKLHSGIVAEHSELCRSVVNVQNTQETMWKAISSKTPLWAFILSIGLVCGGLGYIYNANANVKEVAKENATIIRNEFNHVNETLREIKQSLRERNGR